MRNRLLLLSLFLTLFACQLTQPPLLTPTTLPLSTPTLDSTSSVVIPSGPLVGEPLLTDLLQIEDPIPFGSWEPVPVVEPEFRYDMERSENQLSPFDLTRGETDQLNAAGFVVREDGYRDLSGFVSQPMPADGLFLITPDMLLPYLFGIHTEIKNDIISSIDDQLIRVTDQLILELKADLTELSRQMADASDPTSELVLQVEAAQRNLAYFSVAGRLLLSTLAVDERVIDLVESELALIEQGGSFISPLSQRQTNYDQLQIEALGVERLKRWYSGYPLVQMDGSPQQLRLQGAQVEQLLGIGSETPAGEMWLGLYRLIAFFEGDQLDQMHQWQALRGGGLRGDGFVLSALDRDLTHFYVLPLPDSPSIQIADGLTYNRVGVYAGPNFDEPPRTLQQTEIGGVRGFSHPLDVAAALGSIAAERMLEAENESGYTGYLQQLAMFKAQYAGFTGRVPHSLEIGHLLAIHGLSIPPDSSQLAHPFMLDDTWADEQLLIWETAFLLHQGELSRSDVPLNLTFANGLVLLPYPHLYATLATQTRQLMTGLAQFGLLSQDHLNLLITLEEELLFLADLAEKSEFGFALSAEERSALIALVEKAGWGIPPTIDSVSTFDRQTVRSFGPAEINSLVVRIMIDGELQDARGPVIRYR